MPKAFCRWEHAGLSQPSTCLCINFLENWGANSHLAEIDQRLTVEFSRELSANSACYAANSACYTNSPSHYPRHEVLGNYEFLSPSCHPWHPLKRVQMPMYRAFWQPDTLFSENSYMAFFVLARNGAANLIHNPVRLHIGSSFYFIHHQWERQLTQQFHASNHILSPSGNCV